MLRTRFLRCTIAGSILAFPMARGADAAQESYPSRPITLIVPWGAGGGADQMGRAVAKELEVVLKTASVPVINVPGADGNNGMVKLVSADADGYTLAELTADTFYGNILSKTPSPWKLHDVVALAVMNSQPFALFVAKDSPYRTWPDVERFAKNAPLKVAISSFGNAEDVLVRLLISKGLKLVSVPFPKPGERYSALLGNQVDLMCDPDGNVKRYIEAGQMRPLLVFSQKRVPEMPNAATGIELGYNIALASWRTIVAKAGTDSEKITLLSNALGQVYKTAAFQEFLKTSWSAQDSYVPPSELASYMATKEREMRRFISMIR